ncbi:MAG: hypothetical protein DMF61_17685 [Blastocatellia bacterium AA13]|nr:MAG: hypothetical protein DMF61_17685 [Blastocatellia bacterium AA13]
MIRLQLCISAEADPIRFERGELKMPITLVNPLDETPRAHVAAAQRLDTLVGKTIGLLDISKPGGSIFLDHIERRLRERYGVAAVLREMKPTFTKPAPADVLDKMRDHKVDAVIEALAD